MPPTEELQRIEMKLAYMENSMQKMEEAVTKGMDAIGHAVTEIAVVMSKIQENGEQHRIIHERIDVVHNMAEEQKTELNILQTKYEFCCGNPKEAAANPVKTALVIALYATLLGSYLGLVLIHAKELVPFITK